MYSLDQDVEIWKDIIGFEGLYKISSKGRVLSLGNNKNKKEKILKHWDQTGYPAVDLNKDGKAVKKTIHRLVAIHFIDNPFNFPVVNHKDHNKYNYSIENLEWCLQSDNTLHHKRKARSISGLRMKVLLQKTKDYIIKHNLNLDTFISEMTKPSR